MIRVFLDANILFSAAYTEKNGLLRLWNKKNLRLVTSVYALKEAQRNLVLKRPDAVPRLVRLAGKMEITSARQPLRRTHGLPEKDIPILEAAAASRCALLLTGDVADFGHLFGKTAEGVAVMPVRMFLAAYKI